MLLNDKPYDIINLDQGIKVIVITGGPCSGKTTGLSRMAQRLADRGYKVLVSPESATKLMLAGIIPREDELESEAFQEEVFLDIMSQEQRMISAAKQPSSDGFPRKSSRATATASPPAKKARP